MAVNCEGIIVVYVVSGGSPGACGVVVVAHSCGGVRYVRYTMWQVSLRRLILSLWSILLFC